MIPRIVQPGSGARRALVVIHHLTAALDDAVRSALGPGPLVVNLTAPPGKGAYSRVGPGGLAPLAELCAWAAEKTGADVGPVALVGFSEGCQAPRAYLLAGGEQPFAVVAIDGTHADWPAPDEARQIAPWRAFFERARKDGCAARFIASHSGLTYVEQLKAPHRPYMATRSVLRRVTGWPLDGADGSVQRDGGAVVYSYRSQDHVAQCKRVLPQLLRDELRPALEEQLGGACVPPEPAPPPPEPPPGPRELPAEKTPSSPEAIAVALRSAWTVLLGAPPPAGAIALLLAQWALETGHGQAMWNWNFGNVKAGSSWGGDWCFFPCNEILTAAAAQASVARARPRTDRAGADAAITSTRADGTAVVWFYPSNPGCRFRAFKTPEAGAAAWLRLLQNGRYAEAWRHVTDPDPAAYVRALKVAGYFTADEAAYRKVVVDLYGRFMRLVAALPEPEPRDDGLDEETREEVLGGVVTTPDEGELPDLSSVRGVQTALVRLGFDPGPVDGKPGPKTTAAVKAFQASRGLTADGVVGPKTRAALEEALA